MSRVRRTYHGSRVPELIHACGKRVRFPSGTEGKRGRCPHCQEPIVVPDDGAGKQPKMHLNPPPMWEEYLDYMRGTGPPPRPVVMPSKLMLAAEADERWERSSQIRPSKFHCPNCKVRLNMDQMVCTGCGVDLRTGLQLGGTARLTEKAMETLKEVPWLVEARKQIEENGGADPVARDQDKEERARRARALAKKHRKH